jgi:hypothetical protein
MAFRQHARGAKRPARRRRDTPQGPHVRKRRGKRRCAARRYPERRRVDDTGIATRDLLALTNAVYDQISWVSAKAAGGSGTATWELLYDIHQDCDAFKAFQMAHTGFDVTAEDEAVADEILAWASDGCEQNDDYRKALAAALASDEVQGAAFATVCSAVAAYRRERDRHVSEAHVGEIGRREVFTLTLKRVVPVPNRFGTAYRLKFYDPNGNELVWFSSRAPASLGIEVERPCAIKATIRRHDDYLGSKRTVISRGLLMEAALS